MGNIRVPFSGSLEGYAKNLIGKNMWRVKGTLSIEDLMSDAYRIYLQCVDMYGGAVDNRAWFMGIYKTALTNHIHAVSKCATHLDNIDSLSDIAEHNVDLVPYIGSDCAYGELAVKIAQAPEDVRRVINYLLDTSYQKEMMDNTWKQLGGKKVESGNEYLCRVFGYNPARKDLIAMVYDYFIDKED